MDHGDDVRAVLGGLALHGEPPPGFDTADVVNAGRRVRRRRGFLAVGGTSLGVAAVVTTAIAVPAALGAGGVQQTGGGRPSMSPSQTPGPPPSQIPGPPPSQTPGPPPTQSPSVTPSQTPSAPPPGLPSQTPGPPPTQSRSVTPSQTPSVPPPPQSPSETPHG